MAKDWIRQAADAIELRIRDSDIYDDDVAELILKYCPFDWNVAYMPVPRCDSCRWWWRLGPDWGLCKMSSIDETIAGLPPVEQRLISSRDLRAVSTYQSFGCVQWEARR